MGRSKACPQVRMPTTLGGLLVWLPCSGQVSTNDILWHVDRIVASSRVKGFGFASAELFI